MMGHFWVVLFYTSHIVLKITSTKSPLLTLHIISEPTVESERTFILLSLILPWNNKDSCANRILYRLSPIIINNPMGAAFLFYIIYSDL